MVYEKGFSFMEVLISLILVSTLSLSLLEQQGQAQQALSQSTLRAEAAAFLDQIEELLFLKAMSLPVPPPPYHFILEKNSKSILLGLSWFKNLGTINRRYYFIDALQ
jgi:prepilin peptidase dependent protein C